ncbi:hypothetical protein [Agriterribacter sp.]|uniref:hypothetical protein n=1 Tax=Agriterribacter sp. TaxID=2821509 RepID=UPI002CBFCC1C|nr:hypothetical protein [Agriterribacter sp.]HRO45942.1 hypothetical protein [Agriterribacter sp.]HRQ19523.1 hypothetical protein [Agriterribacter sp.]
MKLIGGVIIIGSLIWEDHIELEKKGENFIRRDWRNQNLKAERTLVPVPIRYGRKSSTRKETYSMVFDNDHELGQGLILEFQQPISSFEDLEKQAIALAIAEGIYKSENRRIISTWGAVGLLINPQLKKNDFSKFEFISKKWRDIYHTYNKTFNAKEYKRAESLTPPIDEYGLLTIKWQDDMNKFDILLATPVIPDPKDPLTAKQIADKMIEKRYDTYFKSNIAHNIRTTQDKEIAENLPNN